MTTLERITKAAELLGLAENEIHSAWTLTSPLECVIVAGLHKRVVALRDDVVQLHDAIASDADDVSKGGD